MSDRSRGILNCLSSLVQWLPSVSNSLKAVAVTMSLSESDRLSKLFHPGCNDVNWGMLCWLEMLERSSYVRYHARLCLSDYRGQLRLSGESVNGLLTTGLLGGCGRGAAACEDTLLPQANMSSGTSLAASASRL